MGLQGPDIFFYYLNPYMRKRKNNICNILHEKNTDIFFDNLLEYTIVLETEEKEICLAYIAGFLCHYALDTHTHPYLYARMQKDLNEHPERRYEAFYYRRIETLMDTLLLKRLNHMEPSQLNLEALVSLSKKERRNIVGLSPVCHSDNLSLSPVPENADQSHHIRAQNLYFPADEPADAAAACPFY